MPDEFDDLLRDVTVPIEDKKPDPVPEADPALEGEPETSQEDQVDEEVTQESEEQTAEDEEKPDPVDAVLKGPQEKPESKEDKAAKAFAEMRKKATTYERALQRAADVAGISVDEFLKRLDDKHIEKKAKDMNSDPEVIRRLEALEATRAELEETRVRMHLESQFDKIKKELGASQEDILQFTSELHQQGFNFFDLNVDYLTLYRGKNFTKLMEQERQKWIARAEKGSNAGTVMTKNGKTSDKGAKVETMSDLEDLLSGMQ